MCSYEWNKISYNPQAAHFMQLIWKGSTDLGVGKAERLKNGQPYTYIVARYKPATSLNSLKNIFKGKFNSSLCRDAVSSSKSGYVVKSKTVSKLKPKQALIGRLSSKQTNYVNRLAMTKYAPLPSTNFNFKQQESYSGTPLYDYGKYRNGFPKIANNGPHNQRYQKNNLSYYAGNARNASDDERRPQPKTSSAYFPKQAEVLEEFLEGDDPTGNADYTGNNPYLRIKGLPPNLTPVMNSVDAEIDDYDDDVGEEDSLLRKAHVPQRS